MDDIENSLTHKTKWEKTCFPIAYVSMSCFYQTFNRICEIKKKSLLNQFIPLVSFRIKKEIL